MSADDRVGRELQLMLLALQEPDPKTLARLDRSSAFLEDDAFLKPVLEDDAILRGSK